MVEGEGKSNMVEEAHVSKTEHHPRSNEGRVVGSRGGICYFYRRASDTSPK